MKLVMILVENIDQVGDLQVVLEEAEQDGQIDFPFGMKTIDVTENFRLSAVVVHESA
jgi:hypothetical protein